MSGPKVVRIVTRSELISICEGRLARLRAALNDWIRVGRRNETVTDEEVTSAEAKLDRLRRLLAADRFKQVQEEAAAEEAFLRQDQQDRLQRAADAAAAERTSMRRRRESAVALLSALKRSSRQVNPGLLDDLEKASAGEPDPTVISRALAELAPEHSQSDDARRALAQRHKAGDDRRDIAEWVASQPRPESDPIMLQIEGRLAEMASFAGPGAAAEYEARFERARDETNTGRRNLLLDSLMADLSAAAAVARKRQQDVQELDLALAELATLDAVVHRGLDARRRAIRELGSGAEPILGDVRAAIDARRKAYAAEARRNAILKSLAGLGYEVREGLSTAWVQQGRVVLRNSARPLYGVELAGDPSTSRLQMRAVAFSSGSAGPDPARDKDAETLWCGDVSALQAQLAASGSNLVIERALSVGATPLKRVADDLIGTVTAQDAPVLREQKLS